MLSSHLKEKADELLNLFEESKDFFAILDSVTEACSRADESIKKILAGNSKEVSGAVNELSGVLTGVRNITQNNSQRKFYYSVELIQQKLKSVLESDQYESDMLKEIYNHIESFTTEFETATSPPFPPQSAVSLSVRVRRLSYLLKGFQLALLFFTKNIDEYSEENETAEELSLFFSSKVTVRQFALKITTIEGIYNEICLLLNVSVSEYPLLINKIESGSMMMKFIGNSKVIGLLVDFIKSSASYLYRNFTIEGQLTAIPKKVESIEAVLDLSHKLKSAGVDTTELNEKLEKSTITIAKELNTLLEGQADITVNRQHISIGDEMQKKLIEDNSAPQIQYKENPDS